MFSISYQVLKFEFIHERIGNFNIKESFSANVFLSVFLSVFFADSNLLELLFRILHPQLA